MEVAVSDGREPLVLSSPIEETSLKDVRKRHEFSVLVLGAGEPRWPFGFRDDEERSCCAIRTEDGRPPLLDREEMLREYGRDICSRRLEYCVGGVSIVRKRKREGEREEGFKRVIKEGEGNRKRTE